MNAKAAGVKEGEVYTRGTDRISLTMRELVDAQESSSSSSTLDYSEGETFDDWAEEDEDDAVFLTPSEKEEIRRKKTFFLKSISEPATS
jgi:hypothetical protein